MGEEIIHGSRGKTAGFLAISLAFVAIGGWMVSRDPGDWRAIGCLVFFGLGAVVFLVQLAAPPTLLLSAQGFTYKGLFGRGFDVAWDDIESFHIWQNPFAKQRMLAWTYRPGRGKATGLAGVSRQLGADGAVPGLWTISLERLLDMMTQRLSAGRP
jgi:hypothetical protein